MIPMASPAHSCCRLGAHSGKLDRFASASAHMATLPIWHGQHDGFATRERKPLCFLAFCSACYKASAWLVIVQATVAGRAAVRVKQRLTIFFGAVACASFGISRKHSRHLKMIVLADSNIMTKFKFI
jgi:hypothetical protein